jgi:hypothetical protein
LILEGTRVRYVIAAEGDLPFTPPRTPMVFATSATRPGASSIGPDEPVRVTGANFVPPSRGGEPVRILLDGKPASDRVPVKEDGSFSVDVPVHSLPGELVITAEQRDGRRLTRERTTIEITRAERQPGPL